MMKHFHAFPKFLPQLPTVVPDHNYEWGPGVCYLFSCLGQSDPGRRIGAHNTF